MPFQPFADDWDRVQVTGGERWKWLAVEIEEIRRCAGVGDQAHDRLALLLTDHLVEVIVGREVNVRLARQPADSVVEEMREIRDSGAELSAESDKMIDEHVGSEERQRLDEHLHEKTGYLVKHGVLTSQERDVLGRMHEYRNAAYHRDTLDAGLISDLVLAYMMLASQLLARHRPMMPLARVIGTSDPGATVVTYDELPGLLTDGLELATLGRLGIAPVMLGLAERPSPNRSSPNRPSEPPVNRRELLFGGAAAAVLVSAVLPGTVFADDESAIAVHAITTAHRRLDGTIPSPALAEPVLAHLRLVTRVEAKIWDRDERRAMAAAVSEVAGLAGWLHWDMHDLGSARRHYRLAVEHAQRVDDPLLTTYMLGSLASFVVHEGEAGEGLALVRHAAEASAGHRPATADAWLAAMAAVAHATSGDDIQAWRALDRAEAAAERIAREEQPPWPWVFPFDTDKIAHHRLACAVRLRRPDVAYAAVDSLSPVASGHRKQGALVLLDLASAHVQNQEIDEALRVATVAVDLAAQTRSERVLSRARQFRRTIPVQAPRGPLRDFDEYLRVADARGRELE